MFFLLLLVVMDLLFTVVPLGDAGLGGGPEVGPVLFFAFRIAIVTEDAGQCLVHGRLVAEGSDLVLLVETFVDPTPGYGRYQENLLQRLDDALPFVPKPHASTGGL